MPNNELCAEFAKIEKRASLYRALVHCEKDIFHKKIQVPDINVGTDYQTKLLPWLKSWGEINDDRILVHYSNKIFPDGKASVPTSYTLRNADVVFDFLGLTKKRDIFVQNYNKIIASVPELSEWCIKNREKIINEDGFAEKAIEIARYFKRGAKQDCYITQWQIPLVDTKFHNKHFETFRSIANVVLGLSLSNKDEFYQYFNLIDRINEISIGCVGFSFHGMQSFSASADELAKEKIVASVVVICENKDHGAYVSSHLKTTTPCLIFYGVGKAILSLRKVPWLRNQKIYYSGDMDKDGFGILSEIREEFPQIQSLLMDCQTMEKTLRYAVPDRIGSGVDVSHLTQEESACFYALKKDGLRIEQERIDAEIVLQAIADAVA